MYKIFLRKKKNNWNQARPLAVLSGVGSGDCEEIITRFLKSLEGFIFKLSLHKTAMVSAVF